jgi:hypothetical protein
MRSYDYPCFTPCQKTFLIAGHKWLAIGKNGRKPPWQIKRSVCPFLLSGDKMIEGEFSAPSRKNNPFVDE